jgi:hypothetical protein
MGASVPLRLWLIGFSLHLLATVQDVQCKSLEGKCSMHASNLAFSNVNSIHGLVKICDVLSCSSTEPEKPPCSACTCH